ncbi:kinase-like domain-containing protein [Xylariales sp. PMI_506]|nr:kinase-like domain-containing protein [Xylariales sp. PMI_506]
MATASPTPIGSNQFSAPNRKPSLRSGLRRAASASSRSQLDRAQSNPALAANASSQPQFSARGDADSSDDEIPVPMKLSALTKALLNDGDPAEAAPIDPAPSRVRTRAQVSKPLSPALAVQDQNKPVKRRSVVSSSVAAAGEERRHTRATSAQISSSRPASPAHSQGSRDDSPLKSRKRVVRLSTTSGAAAAQFGTVQPSKRRSTSMSTSQRGPPRPPSRESQADDKANISELRDVNTPQAQGIKSVRIAVGSSGGRVRSGASGISSRQPDSASKPPPAENEVLEEPATATRQRIGLTQSSGSRPGSHGSRSREEENQGVQGSMRMKRVGKVTGSFLRGPARRGLRRQSDEDGIVDADVIPMGQEEGESQAPQELLDGEPLENLASSYYVPDRLASGSPISAKNPARQRESSAPREEPRLVSRHTSPNRDENEIPIPHYRIPPPRPEMLARHDQENEIPSTLKRNKALGSSIIEHDLGKLPAVGVLRQASPERKPLAVVSQNEPRRTAPAPPPKMSILETATSTAGAATTQQAAKKRNYLKVNGKYYTRLDSLGRGGSAKVYRVAADNGKMFALKRVTLENTDEVTIRGYKGEIDLLKKLNGLERVINLYDFEMNEEKQVLSLLMEMGELDLNTLLRLRLSPENARFDPVFVRYYWQEMLECLAAVHAYDVVHSDLKPHNFVLVQGRLKLIDFGIANAIQTDETVNVHREAQVGTPSYMSPESLLDSNTTGPDGRRIHTNHSRPKLVKIGKPSDIWGLGCILFQMVYGTTPFGHIQNQMARCHAIIDWDYAITYKERGIGDVPVPPSLIRTMKRCLNRDQHLRPTCAELLSMGDPFLYPVEVPKGQLPISEELLGRIIHSVVARCRERMPTEGEVLSAWPSAYWGSIAKAVGKDMR